MNKCKNCGDELKLDSVQVGGVHMFCEYEYFYQKTERMIKVRPIHGGNGGWCVMEPHEAEAFLLDAKQSEEEYESEEVFMSKGQIEVMPEHGGW